VLTFVLARGFQCVKFYFAQAGNVVIEEAEAGLVNLDFAHVDDAAGGLTSFWGVERTLPSGFSFNTFVHSVIQKWVDHSIMLACSPAGIRGIAQILQGGPLAISKLLRIDDCSGGGN
jgi:hypothetical protein